MSALSGMGVAFYTSLFGAGCSILLTILRTLLSPQAASNTYARAINEQKEHLKHFDESLEKFNSGVHDFSEVDYNLRGSVERMDLAVRDLASTLREINRRIGGKQQ